MTDEPTVPQHVVDEDVRLDGVTSRASEDLARHRWHWTLDESNPDRVSLRAYARAVARAYSVISKHARGYAMWTDLGGEIGLGEAIERANMSAETEAATEAVAEARGLDFAHTRKSRVTEVKRVREVARERAEERGTSVEAEALKVAEWLVKSEQAEHRQTHDRQQRLGLRLVAVERHLDKAKRALADALDESRSVEWDTEAQTLLGHTLDNVKALLGLVDSSVRGDTGVDWDAELERIS